MELKKINYLLWWIKLCQRVLFDVVFIVLSAIGKRQCCSYTLWSFHFSTSRQRWHCSNYSHSLKKWIKMDINTINTNHILKLNVKYIGLIKQKESKQVHQALVYIQYITQTGEHVTAALSRRSSWKMGWAEMDYTLTHWKNILEDLFLFLLF